ncbi:unnamed protein product [Boreogadus saida]
MLRTSVQLKQINHRQQPEGSEPSPTAAEDVEMSQGVVLVNFDFVSTLLRIATLSYLTGVCGDVFPAP